MNVKCEKCSKWFKMTQNKLKVRKLKNGIEETYYKCPKCKVEYKVCITDEEIRDIQKQIIILKAIIRRKIESGQKEISETPEYQSLIEKKKRLMDKLNGRATDASNIV